MSEANGRRPNILWYCTDQQRDDTIRALGNAHINTPNLDALCESGVAFENAYCPVSYTHLRAHETGVEIA